jgi:hypothetical protein
MSLQITSIADAISKLTVTGVKFRDLDEIKEGLGVRDTPCFMPKPDGYVTDFEVVRDSYGAAAQRRMTVEYTLNYSFFYAVIGSGRLGLEKYSEMVVKAFSIIDAIIAYDSTVTADLEVIGGAQFGPVVDPAGNVYHGCIISVRVTEFVN